MKLLLMSLPGAAIAASFPPHRQKWRCLLGAA